VLGSLFHMLVLVVETSRANFLSIDRRYGITVSAPYCAHVLALLRTVEQSLHNQFRRDVAEVLPSLGSLT
jgi:hypothetical protein